MFDQNIIQDNTPEILPPEVQMVSYTVTVRCKSGAEEVIENVVHHTYGRKILKIETSDNRIICFTLKNIVRFESFGG